MTYPIILHLSYEEFIKIVKNIYTCCAFLRGSGYIAITEDIHKKIKNGDLIITEYHDAPLGEVIYISPNSKYN